MRRRRRDNQVEFEDVYVAKATDKAILCNVDGNDVWIPQSQVHADSEAYKEGDRGTLVISEWIANEKGLL